MKTKHRDFQGGDVDPGTQGAKHNATGGEILDDRPVATTLRFRGKAISSFDDARSLLELANRVAQHEGLETEAEANDFDIPDDEGFEGQGSSVFTEQDEQELLAIHRRLDEEKRRRERAALEKKRKSEIDAAVKRQSETKETPE